MLIALVAFRNDQWQFSVQNDPNLFLINLLAAILETNPGYCHPQIIHFHTDPLQFIYCHELFAWA